MADKVEWKIPAVKRALKVAHDYGLHITRVDLDRNGTIRVHVSDPTATGDVALTVPPPNDWTGEAA